MANREAKEIAYEETADTAILHTDADSEWIETDSIVVPSDWA